ncbi:hypothetical protein C5167_009786 [Papaver somniferum]|uniref:Uncharacterized protein n=1 Tax=Papaver somniferum TaxID=3469 RepID=A0A4Y7K1G7_PAPSO|nr:hypothetical protein C5167_009786 [Papaver somniferum]
MDRKPEELQFLGIFGVFNEAYSITVSWRKIFSQIALAFILPLSVVEIMYHQQDDGLFSFFLPRLTSEWAGFWIFMVIYHLFLHVLSLLSTSAVVYTIACAYTKKEIIFIEVASVVPTNEFREESVEVKRKGTRKRNS